MFRSHRVARLTTIALMFVSCGTLSAVVAEPDAPRFMHPDGKHADAMQGSSMQQLLEGLASSMSRSAHYLREDRQRLRATRALDDARRAARVLKEAAFDEWKPVALKGYETVQSARHALQMGRPARAALILENGSERLRAAAASTDFLTSKGGLRLGTAMRAQGVRLINAHGTVVGELERIDRRPNGPSEAVLKVGGVTDLFGFVDFDNKRVTIPADHVVLGDKMAALASDATAEQLSRRSTRPTESFATRE